MSQFRYHAFNATGEAIAGTVEAESVTALEMRVRETGGWLLDAQEGELADENANKVSRVRVKRRELIGFFVQMSLLLKAGITLPNALDRLAADFERTRMGGVAVAVAQKVKIGVPLHSALESFPRTFSPQVVAMVQAGEVSGRMPEVFQSLTGYFEWMDNLLAEVRQALIYPVIVLFAAAGFVLMLFTFVVPRFVSLLQDLSLEVPVLTRIVMGISEALVSGWPVLVALAVGLPVGLRLALQVPRFARAWDAALMRLPVFGELVAMFAFSRLAHNLGMLYRSGVPLLRGLEICRSVVGNRAVEQALEEVRHGVAEGTPMSKGMTRHDLFPRTFVTMISTGESSGTLDVALQSVAEYYNTLIPRRIKVVFALFNPAVMLSLIGVIGVVALSVILPILQLWQVR